MSPKLNESFSRFCAWCKPWQMTVNFRKPVSMSFNHNVPCLISRTRPLTYTFKEFQNISILALFLQVTYPGQNTSNIYVQNHLRNWVIYGAHSAKHRKTPNSWCIKQLSDRYSNTYAPCGTLSEKAKLAKLKPSKRNPSHSSVAGMTVLFHQPQPSYLSELTTLTVRHEIKSLTFFHRIIHSSYRLSSNKYATTANPTQTRSNHTLNVSPYHPRTDTFKYRFFPGAIERWNSFPGHVRSIDLGAFPSKIQLL